MDARCPRCSDLMVRRRNRETNEPFLGCSRYPGCHGTRPIGVGGAEMHESAWRPRRPGPQAGFGSVAIYLFERRLHRPLTSLESVLVVFGLVAAVIASFILFFMYAVPPLGDWLGHAIARR